MRNEKAASKRRKSPILALSVMAFICFFATMAKSETLTWSGREQLTANPFAPFAYYYPYAFMPSTGHQGNTVNITGGPTLERAFVYGGYSTDYGAEVTGNTVNISGGVVNGMALGGMVAGTSSTLYKGTGNATFNTIIISGAAKVEEIFGGFVYGYGSATGNKAYVKDEAEVAGSVTGGSGATDARRNAVYVSGGTVGGAVIGGVAITGDAEGNTVSISGGVVGSASTLVVGGRSTTGNAINNTVLISGGNVTGDVAGGLLYHNPPTSVGSDANSATGNTVTLTGAPDFTSSGTPSNIYGGLHMDTGNAYTGDSYTGNTLNIWNYSGSRVGNIQNFQHYNFLLPALASNGYTALQAGTVILDPTAESGAGVTAQHATITGLNVTGGGRLLQTGDRLTLISASSIIGALGNSTMTGAKGVTLLYEYALAQSSTEVTATVTGVRANPSAKSLSEGRIAGLSLVNQGADLAAGQGLRAALAAVGRSRNGSSEGLGAVSSFSAVSVGSSRYHSGSHVDLDSVSLMTGIGWSAPLERDALFFGAFFEAGWGAFDSLNSPIGSPDVSGAGESRYLGFGVLAHYSLTQGVFRGLYAESSLRAGRAVVNYRSADLGRVFGDEATYDADTIYYGGHFGLGYLWSVTDKISLDVSSKCLWSHQAADDVSVLGDPVHFYAVDSYRWRSGARLTYAVTEQLSPFLGVAYDHEFGAKAKASAYGHRLPSPDIAGGTGIAEVGLTYAPAAASGLSIDLVAQGYSGVRDGLSGHLQIKFEF